ncbi:MAG TPA: adenylate/guanylate cyclase domain-containing protein [Candidatus Ozemobacteraceae bacterium]|nr:adenylate/guanylate cyclase domain-containing protein [Candidatus Ozemobacteraceae bacterium]
MNDMTVAGSSRRRPWIFAACVVVVLTGLAVFWGAFNLYLDRAMRENRDDMAASLTSTVLDMAERFNRNRWMRQSAEPVLRAARARPWDAKTARTAGRAMKRLFPAADVFAFDAAGRIAWQSGNEPARTREMLWAEVVALVTGESGEEASAARGDRAQRICRSMHGSFTSPQDLAGSDGMPQYFLDRYRLRLSWAIPCGSGGSGGLWLFIDPLKLPSRRIARDSISRLSFVPDQAMIVRKSPRGIVCEARLTRLRPPEQVVSRLLWNQTEIETPDGLWMARYIPHENGRYALVGIRRDRIDGRLAEWAGAIRFLACLIAASATFAGWMSWMREHPPVLSLRTQVVIMFLVTAVLPVVMLCGFGWERSRETARLEKNRWEGLLKSSLSSIDSSYREFQKSRRHELEAFESVIVNDIISKNSVEGRVASFASELRRYEMLVILADGREIHRGRGIPPIHKGGDYPVILRLLLARMIEATGRKAPDALYRSQPLVQGDDLERALANASREIGEFNKMRIGKRNMVARYAWLADRGGRILGLIGYAFDETEFARPFIERMIGRSKAGEYGAVRVCVLRSDGTLLPAGMRRDPELMNLFYRVQSFRAHETAFCSLSRKQALVTGFFPEQIGGYLLAGWVDAALLDEGRRTILQFLGLMLAWSVIWMIGCALFLSRRLVDQVGALTAFVGDIARGNYDARTPVTSDDELGRLAATFNQMAEKLGHRERMRRLVSDQVWDEVRKDDSESLELGGERRDVAILFSHLHGFDALLERISPEAVIDLLNGYFSRLDPVIRANEGSIDKLIGDAVMAVFFAREGAPHPAERAVAAARDMMAAQETMNGERAGAGLAPLRTDIGIHYGPAISGKVGSREGRIDYTVIGDSVNTAARLCTTAAARPGPSIIISEAVVDRLESEISLEPLEPITLKGKTEPLRLFSIGRLRR